jgi:Family of unknown function (DUF5309)
MPSVTTADQVAHEDLSDVLILADVRMTPVTSRMKKGAKLKAMRFDWPVEKMGNRRTTPIPEGKDVDAFEGGNRTRLSNRCQKFWRTPRVTTEAEEVTDAAGVAKEYNHQLTKYIKEEKRDIEVRILGDQDSQEDTGIAGYGFKGLGSVISTSAGTDTATLIPAGYRTPSAQIYTGLLADFDETSLNTMMQSRRSISGASSEFTLFVALRLKTQFANFGRYVPNKDGATVVVRTERAAIDKRKLAVSGIDIFEGDFGTADIEIADWMPTDARGYGLDMDMLKLRPLQMCNHYPLPFQGGGQSGLVQSILSYEYGDPRSLFKIAPSDEVTANLGGN